MRQPMRPRSSQLRTAALAVDTSTQVLEANPRRVYVVFMPSTTAPYTLSLTSPVVFGQGLTVAGGDGPLVLRIEDVGDAVQKAWFAVSTNGLSFGILEALGDD